MRFLAAIFCLAASTLAGASLAGEWKLDPSRSRMDPPVQLIWVSNGPKSYKHTNPSVKDVAWPVDGTPVPSPAEDGVLVSRRRITERSIEETRTRAGKPISKVIRTISPDGKRLTVTGSGVNSEGQKFDYSTVYARLGAPGKDPLAGTWEEDFFAQAREAILLTISDTPESFGVSGKSYGWKAPFSGMQAPVKLAWADHAHVERTGEGSVRVQLTKASRVTRDETYSLAKDGRTLTVRRKLPGARPPRGFLETYIRVR